jgi:sterol desaturase/sphingolipid hydroxylase (fatty acid hydroxylase superfamily)
MDFLIDRLASPVTAFLARESDLYWPYFLTTIPIALAIYWVRRLGPLSPRDFLAWLCPRAIHAHPSAKLDWAIFALNSILFAGPTLGVAAMVAAATDTLLTAAFGAGPAVLHAGPATAVGFTLALVLAGDFAVFLAHYWMHKSALMWEFHKVHHSALVLMPITAYRQHPVEEFITGTFNGIAVGVVGGLFLFGSADGLRAIDIAGHNAVEFAFILAARHLRHSHISLSYGRVAEHVFVSPAQHRIHHSIAPRHRDRNLGQIFALWDWLFGTLYPCRPEPEEVVYGIDGSAEHAFKDLNSVYFGPFRALATRAKAEI